MVTNETNDDDDDGGRAIGERDWEDGDEDAAEIRYALTALGEAALGRDPRTARRARFRGFGPCGAVA